MRQENLPLVYRDTFLSILSWKWTERKKGQGYEKEGENKTKKEQARQGKARV